MLPKWTDSIRIALLLAAIAVGNFTDTGAADAQNADRITFADKGTSISQ